MYVQTIVMSLSAKQQPAVLRERVDQQFCVTLCNVLEKQSACKHICYGILKVTARLVCYGVSNTHAQRLTNNLHESKKLCLQSSAEPGLSLLTWSFTQM